MKNRFYFAFFCISLFLGTSSCSHEEKAAPQSGTVAVQLVAPPELFDYLNAIKANFESRDNQLTDGRRVQLQLTYEPSVSAAKKIASGDLKVEVWIAPKSLINFTNSNLHNLGARQVYCKELFHTPIVFAARPQTLSDLQINRAIYSSQDLLGRNVQDGKDANQPRKISLVAGVIDRTSSGYSALMQFLSLALVNSKDPLSLATFEKQDFIQRLQKFLGVVSVFALSDDSLMERTYSDVSSNRIVALTSEQQVINFNKRKNQTEPALSIVYPSEGSVSQDYNICLSDADWVTAAQRVAIVKLTQYLRDSDAQKAAQSLGYRPDNIPAAKFSDPLSAKFGVTIAVPMLDHDVVEGAELTQILNKWKNYTTASANLFLLDSSGTTLGSVMNAGKIFIRSFLTSSEARNLTAIQTFADEAKLKSDFTTDRTEQLKIVDQIQAGGGSAIYDSIAQAYKLMGDPKLLAYRKNLFLFTDGKDTKSRMSLADLLDFLKTTAPSLNVNLQIIAVQSEGVDLSDLINIAKAANGSFKKALLPDVDRLTNDLVRDQY